MHMDVAPRGWGGGQDCQVTLQGLCFSLISGKNICPSPGVKVKVKWRGSGSFSVRAGGICQKAELGSLGSGGPSAFLASRLRAQAR